MSKARLLSNGLPLAEAFDLGIDQAWIDIRQHGIAETQTFDGTGGEILHKHVGLARKPQNELFADGRLQVDRQRLFVGVEAQKVKRVPIRFGQDHAPGIAGLGVFNLHHLRPEPGERLGARGARLELREVQYAHALEALERLAVGLHCVLAPVF